MQFFLEHLKIAFVAFTAIITAVGDKFRKILVLGYNLPNKIIQDYLETL